MLSEEDRSYCAEHLRRAIIMVSAASLSVDNGEVDEALRALVQAEAAMGRAKMYLGIVDEG